MNSTDYDKSKFSSDKYGNLVKRQKAKVYKGFAIDNGIGNVKVWDKASNFIGDFPDVKSAKEHIDSITK